MDLNSYIAPAVRLIANVGGYMLSAGIPIVNTLAAFYCLTNLVQSEKSSSIYKRFANVNWRMARLLMLATFIILFISTLHSIE